MVLSWLSRLHIWRTLAAYHAPALNHHCGEGVVRPELLHRTAKSCAPLHLIPPSIVSSTRDQHARVPPELNPSSPIHFGSAVRTPDPISTAGPAHQIGLPCVWTPPPTTNHQRHSCCSACDSPNPSRSISTVPSQSTSTHLKESSWRKARHVASD